VTRLVRVELVIHREDDAGREYTIEASISAEDGWNQWGEPTAVLGDNVDLLMGLTDAVIEATP